MGISSTVGFLLVFLGLCGMSAEFVPENCTDYKLQFERVFSVPGDVAMLNSTLLSPDVFDYKNISYNITWYNNMTGQEMHNQTGLTLVRGETLWFLNVTLEDAGIYVTVLRTPFKCYMQATKLEVDLPVPGQCGRPQKADQTLTKGVIDTLHCPLGDYMSKLNSYNITSNLKWYRGCEPIEDEPGRYTYRDMNKLTINKVDPQDQCSYTCTLTFTLGGITGSVSETIDGIVKEEYSLVPQVHKPANEVIKAQLGSSFSKECLVFVPGVGIPIVDVVWLTKGGILDTSPSVRIYTPEARIWTQDVPKRGVWIEQPLIFSELREEDFYVNYTCRAYSSRGFPEGYFTLLPADPNITLPIGLVLGGVMVLFVITVIIYYTFKIDIVLWFRRSFPVLYSNKDMDGKLYDAYVAYPQPCELGFSNEVEMFALHTLPQVLEKACDYKLFIAGRDSVPGQAIIDSVEENIQSSRRLLLLYTASTFTKKRHTSSTSSTNNNNISKNSDNSDKTESKISDSSFDDCEKGYPARQQFECMAAMHRALLEGSLKVVLVELEEITQAQLALFPESVRHLRKKQGAVCWWKNQKQRPRWRSCARRKEDEGKSGKDSQLDPSLTPSSRFWKEVRYHMPVRGKREVYPEKTALLNI